MRSIRLAAIFALVVFLPGCVSVTATVDNDGVGILIRIRPNPVGTLLPGASLPNVPPGTVPHAPGSKDLDGLTNTVPVVSSR